MGYPDGYGPEEHRRALDAMLADVLADPSRRNSPLEKLRAAGGLPRPPDRVVDEREVAGLCEVQLHLGADRHTPPPALKLV